MFNSLKNFTKKARFKMLNKLSKSFISLPSEDKWFFSWIANIMLAIITIIIFCVTGSDSILMVTALNCIMIPVSIAMSFISIDNKYN